MKNFISRLPKSLTTVTTFSKILAGVLFITLPFIGFYLGMEYQKITCSVLDNGKFCSKSDATLKINSIPISLPITPLSPTIKTNQSLDSLPNDWTLISSKYCPVKIPVPPNKEPYFELIGQDISGPEFRRFWQLRETNQATVKNQFFINNSSLMYVADIEASGYIAGLVSVQCTPNTRYTLENVVESYIDSFGTESGITIKNKQIIKLWGKNVIAAVFQGGMYDDNKKYFIVTDKFVYLIDKKADSDKEFIKNTTQQIFDNLQFID